MKLINIISQVKAVIDADPLFAGMHFPEEIDGNEVSEIGVLLCDDLLPAGIRLDRLVELAHGGFSPYAPEKTGLALIAFIAGGEQRAGASDVSERSALIISVEENYHVNRSGGTGVRAMQAMQRIKKLIHEQFYDDGEGDALLYRSFNKDDTAEGLIAYDIHFEAITNETET